MICSQATRLESNLVKRDRLVRLLIIELMPIWLMIWFRNINFIYLNHNPIFLPFFFKDELHSIISFDDNSKNKQEKI